MIDTIRIKSNDENLFNALSEKRKELSDFQKGYIDISRLKEKVSSGEIVEISIDDLKRANNDFLNVLNDKGIDIQFVDFFQMLGLGSWNRDINIVLNHLERSTIIEFSLTKFVYGNNILSIDNDLIHLYDFFNLFYDGLGLKFNNKLFKELELLRLDLAFNYKYDFDVIHFVGKIFKSNNKHKRKHIHFYSGSLYFKGRTYTLKIYDKYEEFKKHDKKDLLKKLDCSVRYNLFQKSYELDDYVNTLSELSKNVTRVEVSIRKAKLNYDKIFTIDDLMKVDLFVYFEYFLDTMGVLKMEKVDLQKLVEQIDNKDDLEFLAVVKLLGTEKAKQKYNKRTYYYKKKRLKEKYNIDIDILNEEVLIDFTTKSKYLFKVA